MKAHKDCTSDTSCAELTAVPEVGGGAGVGAVDEMLHHCANDAMSTSKARSFADGSAAIVDIGDDCEGDRRCLR